MDITLITSNKDKLREAEEILGIKLKTVDLELDEIQELDAKKIATHKVQQAFAAINKPVFVWDQSIYIDCLNGFPGPLIKWFWQQVTLEKICEIANFYKNPVISTETLLTYHDGQEIHTFVGKSLGQIPKKPRGEKGWGWDPIFIPEGFTTTYAEMEPDKVIPLRSHGTALKDFREFLNNRYFGDSI